MARNRDPFMTALRRQMNANGIQVRVVKNTLLRRAAAQAGCRPSAGGDRWEHHEASSEVAT